MPPTIHDPRDETPTATAGHRWSRPETRILRWKWPLITPSIPFQPTSPTFFMPVEGNKDQDEVDVFGQDFASQADAAGQPLSTFVYPVRSLLSGIQAASESAVSSSPPRTEAHIPVKTFIAPISPSAVVTSSGTNQNPDYGVTVDGHCEVKFADTTGRVVPALSVVSCSGPGDLERRPSSPNFRDFPRDEDPLTPRFSSIQQAQPRGGRGAPNSPVAADPSEEPVAYEAHTSDGLSADNDWNLPCPAQLSEAAADAFADPTTAPIALVPLPPREQRYVSNFSQSGIVHLGPIRSVDSSFRLQSVGSSVSQRRGYPGWGNISPMSRTDPNIDHSRSRSLPPNDAIDAESRLAEEPPQITFRYQHIEDENGHHLIVGREGTLTKCEDEPIRTPGAVQGYGVLIVLEEDYESGNLVVRQVSENSAELLGLSPRYLFSLQCFTQTLPQRESDQLLDNISHLSEDAANDEEQAENLHVFMLSGWGEPDGTLSEGRTQDAQHRRLWTCWCAAHRPEPSQPSDAGTANSQGRNIIILEFELERDSFNPLYPPAVPDTNSPPSGVSSPSDGSGVVSDGSRSGGNSDSSGRTLVSSGTDERPASSTGSCLSTDTNHASVTANSYPTSSSPYSAGGSASASDDEWMPNPEDILESTTSLSRPLPALERLRRNRRMAESTSTPDSARPESSSTRGGHRFFGRDRPTRQRGGGVGMMDVFAVMSQINEQLGAATDLEHFLKVTVGVVKDLTQFHRVLVYQFDEVWNGKVVAELVDWNQTHDLYNGLHFPASDIPPQARQLYALNKVRLLYDRELPTARLIARSKEDLDPPLNMTHCHLRAMSPIHIKYLANMGVRASMSVSIMAFGQLWGLVACHSYGAHGMRVSFPVRQMLRLLSQSISRNVERLSYAQRLQTRKLINPMSSDQHPSGYIVSNADDLLGLFDADFGVLVIGEGAKILGPNAHSQETLVIAEYLRLKQFDTMQVSQAITVDYPDLQFSAALEVIAGLLYVPLSSGGRDFIAFLRKGQPREIKWAGRPPRPGEPKVSLEPRSSFKAWCETVAGRCRLWTDEQLETAGVLALVYGKFIEVWRQKESAVQATKLTNILLSNASHEVRTPLNHIINYLELALNGQLDIETRENLSQSHAASKSLLFTINDLLDLTRLESGNETSFNDPFNLPLVVEESTHLYRNEAARRGLGFEMDMSECPNIVIGDAKKIRTLIANVTANAVKYTEMGKIRVECRAFDDETNAKETGTIAVEMIISDTGCGIPSDKLEGIFREFEQVEMAESPGSQNYRPENGLGLGLAVVARIVEQLGGQLRVDSKVAEGSRFSFLIPFAYDPLGYSPAYPGPASMSSSRSRTLSCQGRCSPDAEIDNLMAALSSTRLSTTSSRASRSSDLPCDLDQELQPFNNAGILPRNTSFEGATFPGDHSSTGRASRKPSLPTPEVSDDKKPSKLRILVVEDNDINRMILAKRLTLDGHTVVGTTNGQEGLEMVQSDRDFDCVLMDIQMPILNGYEATERIRALEQKSQDSGTRPSQVLNGRLPIFAVSASLFEERREEMHDLGMDGWILKPIDFKRLRLILRGVTDLAQRKKDIYHPGCSWEAGGWLAGPNARS